MMKLIVGLGNPGEKYADTRHNIGFKVIDQLANQLAIPLDKRKFKAEYGIDNIEGKKVILCKPQTYMNLSGEAVRPLLDYYDIAIDNMLVIYDDLDIAPGKLRLRQKGSAGGHNGMKSIIYHVGSEQFKRLRFGIGRPSHPRMQVVDYVLARFLPDERPVIDASIEKAAKACEKWITTPFSEVMNEFNQS